MGRILEYVVLLSNLSLILGGQQFKELGNNYERQKQENFTHALRQHYPKGQSEFFSRRALPLDSKLRRRLQSTDSKQMRRYIGLQAFAADDVDRRYQKRNFSEGNFRNYPRRNIPVHSQGFYPRKNSKNFASFGYRNEIPSQKLTKLYDPKNASNSQNKRPEDIHRRYNSGRNARYHPRHSAKVCDACNSVPWVPLLKVPDSYRQQRTHVTELHPTPQQNFNFDYHGFASNTHDVLLPSVPLVPPIEPIYDGTISSSFGLPVGNIPTSHGMLAPINKFTANTIDYSSSFNFYSPHGLLDNHPFPEISPVPVVPIHDSGQFLQFDSSIPDLVPPPAKHVDVSNVVLTISENSPTLEPPKPVFQDHKHSNDLSLSSSGVGSHTSHSQGPGNNLSDFGKLEIVKSIPLAEFTSSVDHPKQQLPLYPPLQSEYESSKKETHVQKPSVQPTTDYNFLTPPAKSKTDLETSGKSGTLAGESSAPKPLTSPSLSWLFSDHTAPPSDSKSTASVLSFATDTQEIASVVNNELRPVSPYPVPVSSSTAQNVGNTKSKKIQIIIPYTTKNKNGHDNNALESVQHEVFQPPVSKSTSENNSLRDFATPALPPLTHKPDTTRDRKIIENQYEKENQHEDGRKVSEMHHIIASNIRELLREEIEKAQSDQNYPLQNNIDNWTALEYSNHKTVGTKAPQEIITQALAVTSIPGTSISHLLLPSKKIPKEYFKTTPIPVFDEPSTSAYKSTNTTVNSSPFTAKPYATTNVYNPTRSVNENKENTPPVIQTNHERNYTEVARGKVNHWGRLNENLVLPEARSKTKRIQESSTTSSSSSTRYISSGSEKVQIVTPISMTTERNYTTRSYRRTTRQTHKAVIPTTETPLRTFLNKLNSTKLEKVTNETSPFNLKFSFNSTINTYNASVPQNITVRESTNSSVSVQVSVVNTNTTVLQKNQTSEVPDKSEHSSINDIIPFRNKELPWESNLNSSQNVLRIDRQRKTLIKQVNLQKSKKPVTSSS